MAALAGFLVFPALYLPIVFGATIVAALFIGTQERQGSEAFMAALAPAWIGFSTGTLVAFVIVTLVYIYPHFNPSENLPDVMVSSIPFITIGIPIGFLTALLSAVVASATSWFLDRRGRMQRLSSSATETEDPNDPFGWRKHVERK